MSILTAVPLSGGSCELPSIRQVRCPVAAIPPGASALFRIDAKVNIPAGCTKIGTSGNDSISGTGGTDRICGLGGNDTIDGLGGDDIIWGDSPDFVDPADFINRAWIDHDNNSVPNSGEQQSNTTTAHVVLGTPGRDRITGGTGRDVIFGQGDNDLIAGDASTSYAETDGASDVLSGGDGNDLLLGQGGADSLEGGPDIDRLHGGAGDDQLDGGGGALNNILYGASGSDFCSNGPLASAIYAGTDRGDIRDETCERPAQGQSQIASKPGAVWIFKPYTINVPAIFAWAPF
jgi:Ca2+-binding RTX toxin-like protein